MKKNFKYALLGAIALTGAVSFSACQSSDEIVDNPNYNPETNSVTTNFVLNVAYADPAATRQSVSTVQKTPNFRGLQDAKLISLATGNSNWLAPYAGGATTGDGFNKKVFTLGTLYSEGAITAANNQASSSHRVLQLEIPVGSDAMLVYARAIPSGTDDENGKVTMNVSDNPESTTFGLVSRLTASNEYNQTLGLAALILNRIMLSAVDATSGAYTYNAGEPNEYTSSGTLAAVSFSTITGAGLPDLLNKAYAKMQINTGEYRNGSSEGLRYQILDIYKTVTGVCDATATNDAEVNAQRLAYEIQQRIGKYFAIGTTTTPYTISFKTIGDKNSSGTIVHTLITENILTEETYSTSYGDVTLDDLQGFPGSFGLPVGVALLKQNSDDKSFAYKNTTADTDNSLLGQSGNVSADKYMYPAELLYFDNSALRVNDAEKKEDDYPNGVNPWNTGSWTGWTANGTVSSSTKSVAVMNNINYGVAMLQTKVGFKTLDTGKKYVDNRKAISPQEENQSFEQADLAGLTLTGVLIGNQYNQVGWNYLATSSATSDYIIYDKSVPANSTVPTPADKVNYTLVFDNYTSGTQTSDVYVALEFINNAKDFYGAKNLIPKGQTFYLVGKLTLDNGTYVSGATDLTWDNYYAIPPYTSGASTKTKRVFIQNYMTQADFKIGETSLQSAFLTVPDLRSTQMSLGLSVDISWQNGLVFESELGK
jgi:hypothetical protein